MKILLVCAGGFSTTMMMDSIKGVINNSQKLDIADFTPMEAIPVDRLEDKITGFDIVLVGPQLSHKYEHVQKVAAEHNKPTVLLTSEIYGAMDGATVLKQALIAMKKFKA
ncbi:MAG: PTS sugar transporter subunit IIB [Sarcina sp.]